MDAQIKARLRWVKLYEKCQDAGHVSRLSPMVDLLNPLVFV